MTDSMSDEDIVRDLDRRWNDVYVRNDRSPFSEILADDLRVTWPDGRSEVAKSKMMEPTPGRRVEFSERGFEIHGATAVTRGRIRIEHPEGPYEQRFVRVYVKRQGRWQAVSVHVFPLDAHGGTNPSGSMGSLAKHSVRIETDRLCLTCPTPAQIDDYYASIVGSNMFDTILWDGPAGPEDLHAFWDPDKRDPGRMDLDLDLAVIEKASDRYIGGVSVRPVGGDPAILDLGYALAPAWQGQGFATEALAALVRHAFEQRSAERIFATIFVGNRTSKRLVERLGFQHEGTLRRVVRKRGVWMDEWLYAITRPAWEASES